MIHSDRICKKTSLSLLVLAIALLPGALVAQEIDATSEDSRAGSSRAFQRLLRTTYLGHAAELPDPSEPIAVLEQYLEIQKHNRQSDRKALDKAVSDWRRFARTYPNSRYAQLGLGRLYQERAALSGRGDLQRAARAFVRANEIGMTQKRILFTRQISELMVQMNDPEGLDAAFGPILDKRQKADFRPGEQHLALLDYADGLAGLKDDRAWEFFEQALEAQPKSTEALNRYARRLLESRKAAEAITLLETRLSRDERIRLIRPAFLRLQAMKMAGRDASAAEAEVEEVREQLRQLGVYFPDRAKSNPLTPATEEFAHSTATDDCRSATYAQNLQCDSSGICLYPYVVNLAEILYNEARGEAYGVWHAVGWTVRNRALQGVSCDVYIGGVNYSSCRTNLPCGDPSRCALSRYYCCVEHGNTTTVGTSHSQFNDAHVTLQTLIDTTFYEAMYVWQGRAPDPTTGFTPAGVSGCTVTCDYYNWCSTGSNYDSPSPNGPMEYLGYNYCAANQTCKTYKGNVCGNNTRATSCSSGGSGDNYFWNRRN